MNAVAAVAEAPALDPNRWRALALAGGASFMTVLDVAIVTIALPSIARELRFAPENMQWVVTAYAITFGGFLLLAGRTADLLGRRRMFMIGVALFTAASLICGLATSEAMLIAARALQGFGAAIIAPAALAIVSAAFPEGAERNRALAVWGALAGSGAAVGVVLGGVLTKYLGWEWIFFVNVPVGALVLALTLRVLRESRLEGEERRLDPFGAVTITASLVLFVYALSKTPELGWGAGRTIGLLAAAAVLLVAFVGIESRTRAPLIPSRIVRLRSVTGSNGIALLVGAAIGGIFFLLTLYAQQVLHYSALQTGLCFLVFSGASIVAAGVCSPLVTRLGPMRVMPLGAAVIAGGLVWFTQVDVHGSFLSDLLPGFLLVGVGMSFVYVPVSIAALAGVQEHDMGLASGLVNTTEQISGAIGVGIVSSVFTSHATALLHKGEPPLVAATHGFQLAFWIAAALAAAGTVAIPLLLWHPRVRLQLRTHPADHAAPTRFVPNRAATSASLDLLRTAASRGSRWEENALAAQDPI